jgi:beta-glucanase (GH16 family)
LDVRIGSGDVNNEIDVFEFWNNSTNDHNLTVHYNGQMCLTDYNGPDYSQVFHTYTVIWNNYKIEWYVDGDLKRRSTKFYTILGQPVDCNGIQAYSHYIMDKVFPLDPMNIIVNLALQTGTYAPDNSTPFPSSLEIDYIRYYK